MSREALASGFDSGIRNLVSEWDPNDPRPEAERRTALFDFMYQTYEASAWIPQSLFDSNLVTQAVVGDVDTIVGDKVGLVLWRDNARVPAFGMAPERREPNASRSGGRSTAWCATRRRSTASRIWAPAPKTFDELWLGEALKRLTSDPWRSLLPRGSADSALAADANRILNSHHHDKIDSLTPRRSTAFAASHVELYMRPHDGAMPAVDEVGRGDVKTPPLWHTAAKMPVGRWYTDGSFHGPFPLMASSMELEKDRPFDALVRSSCRRSRRSSSRRHSPPPAAALSVRDRSGAGRAGRELFYSKEIGCARCHGVYDGRGNVEWPGVHVDVGTDRVAPRRRVARGSSTRSTAVRSRRKARS